MKKFKFKDSEIVFDDNFEFYNQYWNYFVKMLDYSAQSFENEISKIKKIENLISQTPEIAQKKIDRAIEYAIEVLVSNGIMDFDEETFKIRYSSTVLYKNSNAYISLCQDYQKVTDAEEALRIEKSYQRASRSQWQGGGFGLGGAIKGAVTAGALNIATNSVRGIGDSIADAHDKSRINTVKRSLIGKERTDDLVQALGSCILRVKDGLGEILEKRTGRDASAFLFRNDTMAYAMLNNLSKLREGEKKLATIKQIIELCPYLWDTFEYLLNNYETLGIDFKEIADIAKYTNKSYYDISLLELVKVEVDKVDCEYFGQTAYDAIKTLGIQYQYFNEQFEIYKQSYVPAQQFAAEMILQLADIAIEDECGTEKNILKLESYYDLKKIYETILNILIEHNIISGDGSNQIYDIFVLPQSKYYKKIDQLLNKVKKQIDIKHKELCTVRGIVFDTIEEADIYRDEIDRFEKIYMEGNSYADYESSKLRKVVELLKKESFKNAKILDAEKQLERRVEILTQHEKSEEYKKGKNLLTEFQDVSIDNLYIYGTQNYLPEAYKVRKNNKIRKYEENCFPIIIYDESQSSNIKGIVVSEKFIYDFNAMLGLNMKAIALDAIAELSANVQKSTIEIRTSTAEKYRLKVSSNLHVDVLVSKLIRALNLKENFENRRNQSQETIQNSISRENIKTEENNLKTTEDSTNIKVTQGDCSQPTQIHDDVVKKNRWWYSAPIILILSFLGVAMFPLEIVAIALLIIRLTKGDSSTVVAKIINIIVCVLTVLFCLICFV